MILIAGRKGKYEEWLTEDGLTTVEGWARDGLTDEQIAHNIGIAGRTYYEWQERFPQFAQAIKKGKAPVDIQVENALLKRALGYEYEETTTEIIENPDGTKRKHIKKVTKMVLPDTLAQFFWLKNRRPDKWRDKPAVEDNSTLEKLDKLLEDAWNAAHAETS